MSSMNATYPVCKELDYWYYYWSSSLITLGAGLLLVGVLEGFSRLCKAYCCKNSNSDEDKGSENDANKASCWSKLRVRCEFLVSGQTIEGKILLSLSVLFSMTSFIFYIMDATVYDPLNRCDPWEFSIRDFIEVGFNCYHIFMFALRFIAARTPFAVWQHMSTIIDVFTIPSFFTSFYFNRQWLGTRLFRGIAITLVPEILQFISILKSSLSIRFAQIVTMFLSVWFCGAGFVHWAETSGELFQGYQNVQNRPFWSYVYFIMVTMTTIGYGEVHCKTWVGIAFITIFMVLALAIFASAIPVFVEVFGNRDPYGGEYEIIVGVKHVVVCGHITTQSLVNFQRDFLHEDRLMNSMKYIFLDDQEISLDMAALFKRQFKHMQFFRGTIMSTNDIERVKLEQAEACIILANHHTEDPEEEDANNLMRVVSIRNSSTDLRILLQLHLYKNKSFCLNLPNWQPTDHVICLSEVKLGFMAQGCLARGCSTLLSNLFVPRSGDESLQRPDSETFNMYMDGADLEVYTSYFSRSFHGKTFHAASKLCYQELEILLIAALEDDSEDNVVFLNPGDYYLIKSSTIGFFICNEEKEVHRALYYCEKCFLSNKKTFMKYTIPCTHEKMDEIWKRRNTTDSIFSYQGRNSLPGGRGSILGRGSITGRGSIISSGKPPSGRRGSHRASIRSNSSPRGSLIGAQMHMKDFANLTIDPSNVLLVPGQPPPQEEKEPESKERFDCTGLFHWVPNRNFEEVLLTKAKNPEILSALRDHIIVCMFKNNDSQIMGLINFAMALRASNLRTEELKQIILVGQEGFLRKEWPYLCNLPGIYVKPGIPSRSVLRAVKINRCHMCVVMSGGEGKSSDPTLKDKEAILCTLDIKTMKFYKNNTPQKKIPSGLLDRIFQDSKQKAGESFLHPRLSIQFTGDKIPMITELLHDNNVQFLDQDDEDDPSCPLYLTQPFACGRAFTSSLMDSVMCTAFFYPHIFGLLRAIVTGTTSSEVEHLLAEGMGLTEGAFLPEEIKAIRDRSRLSLMPFSSGVFEAYSDAQQNSEPLTYGELVIKALDDHRMLCMGLYRMVDVQASTEDDVVGLPHRYAVMNPPPATELKPADQVYVLVPFQDVVKKTNKSPTEYSQNDVYLAESAIRGMQKRKSEVSFGGEEPKPASSSSPSVPQKFKQLAADAQRLAPTIPIQLPPIKIVVDEDKVSEGSGAQV